MTKKYKKKLFLSMIVLVSVFVLVSMTKIKAGTAENITGWLWGGSDNGTGINSGVGWISMNNTNTAGGVSYGVNIPGADGNLSGYAFSENLGYIAFDNSSGYLNGCPDGNCVATRTGNALSGWARFVEIANASALGNSGGWLGWIKLKGLNYGVTIGSDGKLVGSAWSDELGYIDFSRAIIPLPPAIVLSANPFTINLDTNQLPQNIDLSWTVSGATTCDKSGGNWSGSMANPTTGTDTAISQTAVLVDYKLTCSGPGGTTEQIVSVTTGCNKKECGNAVCASTFIATGTSDNAICVADSNCSVDDDCAPRGIQSWKEVSP